MRNSQHESIINAKIKKFIISLLSIALGVFAIHGAKELWGKYLINQELNNTNEQYYKLKNSTSKDNIPESMEEVSRKMTAIEDEKLAKLDKPNQIKSAASQFIGFYYAQTIVRQNYCRDLGVDIQKFNRDFKEVYKQPYAKSMAIINPSPKDYELLISIISNSPIAKDFIKSDIENLAAQTGKSLKEACELMNIHSQEINEHMSFANNRPHLMRLINEYSADR